MEFFNLFNRLVIDKNTGQNVGYINDLLFDLETGKINSILVSKNKNLILFSKHNLMSSNIIQIPYENIKIIGQDVILVDIKNWFDL